MKWLLASASHIGGRMEQQDRVLTLSGNKNTHLLVVADGMGGHRGGALAAQAVIDAAQSLWMPHVDGKNRLPAPTALLEQICLEAQKGIQHFNHNLNIYPHSTCVILYIQDEQAHWTYLGDSRLYHFRKEYLLQRTRDHSVVQMLFEMGRISEEEMAVHQDQGRLLKGLGGEGALELEFFEAATETGDIFVLCSDGLWEQFNATEIRHELPENLMEEEGGEDLQAALEDMVRRAVSRAGPGSDNVSIAVARRLV